MTAVAPDDVHDPTSSPRPNAPPKLLPRDLRVTIIRDARELAQHVPAWRRLADAALEPNPFYEPWMLLPALEHLRGDAPLEVALVHGPTVDDAPALLCGLFPLERRRHFHGVPLPSACLWRHRQCFSTTPLLHAGHAAATLGALFDWLRDDQRAPRLVELPLVATDGPLHRYLTEALYERGLEACVFGGYARALLRPAADAEQYLRAALSSDRRRELRRRERRLAELGRLQYQELSAARVDGDGDGDGDRALAKFTREFLALEARGWKGREASALGSTPGDRRFFERVLLAAFRDGRLVGETLRLDGAPIAAQCTFTAGEGAFAFKIAFDERHARHSPGALLVLYCMQRMHERTPRRWLDTCSAADSPFKQLFTERRLLHSVVLQTRADRLSGAVVAGLPLFGWVRRRLRNTGAS